MRFSMETIISNSIFHFVSGEYTILFIENYFNSNINLPKKVPFLLLRYDPTSCPKKKKKSFTQMLDVYVGSVFNVEMWPPLWPRRFLFWCWDMTPPLVREWIAHKCQMYMWDHFSTFKYDPRMAEMVHYLLLRYDPTSFPRKNCTQMLDVYMWSFFNVEIL
jgi:hypothetical protein